ncbi:MAG: metalloregulator ArsR/SmtB family transcription factor [Maricaulis sp.]|jgi:DNA-binding transcriptional ArsR family regulator|nr:metalloregulator ArsR/SmtB family transcription factor [Maricaulis sp.]MDG2044402.1 metalloregulator ArsR/SmtB family transcription factor [Maricaulis sp.]
MMDMKNLDRAELEANASAAASLLRALSNETRLMILCQLVDGELSVGQLLERINMSQSALSQHLARLRQEELVITRREAQSVIYSIGDPAAETIIKALAEIFCSEDTP